MNYYFLLAAAFLFVTRAEWIDIDWSQVKPIEEFDHYWARLPAEWQFLRHHQTPNQRITNGREATPGQFPYQVALLSQFVDSTALCGGSILTNNYILTAAHCVEDALGGTAVVGAHNRMADEESQQRIGYGADGVILHPEYSVTDLRNDVALVHLNSAIEFNERVQPTRLPAADDNRTFSGMTGTVSGFGRTSDSVQTPSTVVMFTSNPIITQATCLGSWGSDSSLIQEQNICLSGAGGRSTCSGDSGSPLTVTSGGSILQVGIASFTSEMGCAIGIPSVFARVSFFREWIVANSDYS
ncbi:brachyurin-like [Sabethes cyaneus]|uniref:brachyurin-like n=1 Tax=Sabethes cyaneus TaxID=53552 RepID=UPI00237D67AB|nr:brachyurin-like [Sabethes cyaneus]